MVHVTGKIPTMPEFVTTRAYGGTFDPIEAWAEEGLAYCHMNHRALLDAHFDDALPQCFVWDTGTAVLAGIAFPSRDSVGRRFPFIICSEIGREAYRMALAPIALGDYLEDAFLAAQDVFALSDRASILARADQLRLPTAEHFRAAEREYGSWLDATPLGAAWKSFVGGDFPERAGPQRVAATIEAVRKHSIVRVVLGSVGAAGGIAVWTEVVTRAVAAPSAIFWSVDGSSMLLSLDPPSKRSFAAVFLPLADVEPAEDDGARASLVDQDQEAPVSQMLRELDTHRGASS
jgi:type VI secretion system ImpM family protein